MDCVLTINFKLPDGGKCCCCCCLPVPLYSISSEHKTTCHMAETQHLLSKSSSDACGNQNGTLEDKSLREIVRDLDKPDELGKDSKGYYRDKLTERETHQRLLGCGGMTIKPKVFRMWPENILFASWYQNYSTPSPLPICINKVLLEHRHSCLVMCCLLRSHSKSRVKEL